MGLDHGKSSTPNVGSTFSLNIANWDTAYAWGDHGAAGYVEEADFNANTILAATADDTPVALTIAEQRIVGRLTGGDIAAIPIGIADNNMLQVDGTSNVPANLDYAKFTANGLEGKSYAEVLTDLSGQAGAAFSFNSQNLTGVGSIGCGELTLTDGSSINLQEAVTFTGATTENLIKFPDDLAVALDFQEGGTSYLKFVTTNGSEAVVFSKNVSIGTATDMLAPLNITGDTASIEDRHEGIWIRGKTGAYIVQINVRGPRLEIGGGASIDTEPAMSINYLTGKVGIGRTPDYILDVDAGEIGEGNYDGLRIVDTGWKATSHPMLEFYNSNAQFGGGGTLAKIYGEIGSLGQNSKLFFAVADSSKNLQDRMVIDKDGNVGIGTTSPNAKLEVAGAIATSTDVTASGQFFSSKPLTDGFLDNAAFYCASAAGAYAMLDTDNSNTLGVVLRSDHNGTFRVVTGVTSSDS